VEAAASLPSSVFMFGGAIVDARSSRVRGTLRCRCNRRLRHHGDRAAGTLVETDRASGAPVQVVFIAEPRAQLPHSLLRACRVTPVALEAVAARQAALRLVSRGVRV